MWKKIIALCLIISCLLSGCTPQKAEGKQYQATFLDLFDTVTSIVGYAESEEAFHEKIQPVHDELKEYHELFDIYHTYDGKNNLKTINEQAGKEAVVVDERILELLADCRYYYELTDGKVNAAMGSVLSLWHEARTAGLNDPANAKLPDEKALQEAAMHVSFDAILLNEEDSSVYISDPLVQLDVGAIAKGWAAQKVAEHAPKGLLISVGGNVCATGPKTDSGAAWVVGIQDPNGTAEEYLHTIYVTNECVVTSGNYQRAYTVDGKRYHHIIDPDTLYPAEHYQAVTIVCEDSGLADVLSTALFQLPQEEGMKLLEQFEAEAVWVAVDGNVSYSPGFKELIRT